MKIKRFAALIGVGLSGLLGFAGCDAGTKSVDACGDGFVDPGEECDTDVGEHSCASLGHYDVLGELMCTEGCKFDRSDCGGRCGDNLVDVGDGEQCDGENLNGKSCQSLGYGGGELSCSPICQLVLTGCTNACGNGYVEGDEVCDDGNNRDGDGCSTTCAVEAGWACEAGNPSACAPVCLDGQVVGDEDCDMENLDGETCQSLGYYGGELRCDFSCAFDESGCELAGRCGDGMIQGDSLEVCDGAELGGQTCQGLGYYGGTLVCQANCRGFDVTDCVTFGRCGDNVLQSDHDEVCDGIILGGRNCQDEGYFTGTLACDADCRGYDVSGCVAIGTCGDGEVQTANGELCDGVNLNGQSCLSRGYYAGDLACQNHCMGFDESLCQGRCGDATVQDQAGEVCDGAELLGETCADQGFYGGTLACSANCTSFNVVGCTGYCGDGTVQSAHGEVCDGLNLSGQSCLTQGYYGGTLTCNPNCQTFGLADCAAVGRCGDSLIQAGFGELCDGSNLGGQTCTSRGYYGGTLACASTCNGFNESACAVVGRCGDGVVQAAHGELCDGGDLNGQTCESRGFYGGILACSSDCRAFVETNCAAVGRCGDEILQSVHGEQCDGDDFGVSTCLSFGKTWGHLSCDACVLDDAYCSDGLVAVTAGAAATCALDTNGNGWCWGYNDSGQLGDGTSVERTTPVRVSMPPEASLLELEIGSYHSSCAVDLSLAAWCWGRNAEGQLGDGTTVAKSVPTPVLMPVGVSFTHVGVGNYFACALDSGGVGWCWGHGARLGNGTPSQSSVPLQVSMPVGKSFVSLSVGSEHTCAIDQMGEAWCWGTGYSGQLGDGSSAQRNAPVAVVMPPAVQFSQISSGGVHTCAVDLGGNAWCWGENTYGNLGNGTIVNSTIPVAVTMPAGRSFSRVSAGSYHVCALDDLGDVWCWGRNNYGALGDGSTSNRTIPTLVTFSSSPELIDVSCGDWHSCSVEAGGVVWCWGRNELGQLGDGTHLNRTSPVTISTP